MTAQSVIISKKGDNSDVMYATVRYVNYLDCGHAFMQIRDM